MDITPNKIKIALTVSKQLFISSLILYLIFFLLESIFPGFITYNFNLNYLLVAVVVFGLVSSFSPQESDTQTAKPKIFDYSIIIVLALVTIVLLYFKIHSSTVTRLVFSIGGGVLVGAMGLYLLFTNNEEVKDKEEKIEYYVEKKLVSKGSLTTIAALLRFILFKEVKFPFFLLILVFLLGFIGLPSKQPRENEEINQKLLQLLSSTEIGKLDIPTPTPTPKAVTIQSPTPKPTPSVSLFIRVYDGGIGELQVVKFTRLLKEKGFQKVYYGKLEGEYKNATISYLPEQKTQANLISELLKESYKIVSETPNASTSSELKVILGPNEGAEEVVGELKLQ